MRVQIGEVDLRRIPRSWYIDKRYQRLSLLVRLGNVPIGWIDLRPSRDNRVVHSEQINAAIGRLLGYRIWELGVSGEFSLPPVNNPPISVVVCTRDRPLSLMGCLDALKRIEYPDFEVLVVDNASRDESTHEVVSDAGFRYTREKRPGLNWARNRGVMESRHPIVAFIDDDALASPGWLAGLVRAFEDPEVMIATGLVLPIELETPAQQAFEDYGGMGKGFDGFTVRPKNLSPKALFWASSWGVGTNMAFRREVFDKVGLFDVALDVGTPTGGGGDIEFFYRAVASGCTLRYEPAAYVWHRHRRDISALKRQIFNNGRSFPAYLMTIVRNDPQKVWAVAGFGLYHWFWGWLVRRLIRGVVGRDPRTAQFAWLEIKGAATSLPAYRAARHTAHRLLTS